MFFYIYMVFSVTIIPLILIIFGKIFIFKAPKKINHLYGYRTKMSMKNEDTWNMAHKICGSLWLKSGIIMLLTSILIMFFSYNKSTDTIGIFGGVISVIEVIIIIFTIFITEKKLKSIFDENGNRKA